MAKDTTITFQTSISEEIYTALKTRGIFREQLALDSQQALLYTISKLARFH